MKKVTVYNMEQAVKLIGGSEILGIHDRKAGCCFICLKKRWEDQFKECFKRGNTVLEVEIK